MVKLKTKLVAHIEMMRPYTLFYSGMLGFASALFISEGSAPTWRLVLAFLVPTLGWLAGLYAGDYYDRDLDAISKPHRPVPSGRVGPKEAFGFMVGYILLGYALALVLSPWALVVAVLTTVFGIAYSKTFKRHAILGNLDRGLLAFFTVTFAAAATRNLEFGGLFLVLCGIFFFHDSSTNLIGAIRDLEGDRDAGYGTVPVVYGIKRSVQISGLLSLSWIVFAVPLFVHYYESWLAIGLFATALVLTAVVYAVLFGYGDDLTRKQALAAHKVTVIERLIMTAAVAAIYGSTLMVLLLLLSVSVAAQVAQVVMRNRYEFASSDSQEDPCGQEEQREPSHTS